MHNGTAAFASGGCWNVGTAKLLQHAGLPIVETSSAGAMFASGQPDGQGLATREFMLDSARAVAAAVGVPVLADLENGFGDSPREVARTIALVGTTGVVGGSIEDATGRPDDPIYPAELACERIRAAAEAARALPFPFTLTARTDLYLAGRPDMAEVVRRAEGFQEAGAHVILAPGLLNLDDLRVLCGAVDVPVAVLLGSGAGHPNRAELESAGVKRIGVAGALARLALTAFLNGASALADGRDLDCLSRAFSTTMFNDIFRRLRTDHSVESGRAP